MTGFFFQHHLGGWQRTSPPRHWVFSLSFEFFSWVLGKIFKFWQYHCNVCYFFRFLKGFVSKNGIKSATPLKTLGFEEKISGILVFCVLQSKHIFDEIVFPSIFWCLVFFFSGFVDKFTMMTWCSPWLTCCLAAALRPRRARVAPRVSILVSKCPSGSSGFEAGAIFFDKNSNYKNKIEADIFGIF